MSQKVRALHSSKLQALQEQANNLNAQLIQTESQLYRLEKQRQSIIDAMRTIEQQGTAEIERLQAEQESSEVKEAIAEQEVLAEEEAHDVPEVEIVKPAKRKK